MGPPSDGTPPRPLRPGSPEVLLLGLALLLRVAWALAAPTDLWFDHVFNDATAWNLARGNGFTASAEEPFTPAIFRTPGYPAFLAGVYAIAGHAVRAGFLANALLDAASCGLLWWLVRRDCGPNVARWSLALAATYPFTIHAVGTLSPESLLVLLGLALVGLLRSWGSSGSGLLVAAAGAVFGLLCLVKPVFLPLPLFLAFAERHRGREWRVALARTGAVGAIGFLLFLPWLLRNLQAFGRPLLAGELGLVLWHGTRDFHPGLETEIRSNFEAAPPVAEDRYERTRRELADSRAVLAQDDAYRRQALDTMAANPVAALVADPLRRVPRLWISARHVQMPPWVGAAAAAASLGYLLLAFGGVRALRGRLADLSAWWILPVALTLAYAAIHAEARYTLPARPALWLLGGAFLAGVVPALRRPPSPPPPA